MSGFGLCPKCNRKGFTRAGAAQCTRCEKGSVPAVVTPVPAAAAPAPAAAPSKPKRRPKPYVKSMGRVVAK